MGLDSVELVIGSEQEFEIQISDDDAEKVRTVQHLLELVIRLAKEQNHVDLDHDETFTKIVDIVSEQLGVKRDKVIPEARFVEDLNMDGPTCFTCRNQ